jgi:hypothetical protein
MNNLIANLPLLAADIQLDKNLGNFQPAAGLTVEGMVSGFIGLILVIAGLSFFFILVIGGIKWILSGGDKAHTEGARNQITAALVGLVIVFSAWAIIALIKSFFGVDLMKLTIPSAGN